MQKLGFTLMELLIVFVLIGILGVLAYPAYNKHLIKARRIHIRSVLLDMAAKMEKHYIVENTYVGALGELNDEYYRVLPVAKKDGYVLKAIPKGSQEKDRSCGVLTLDQDGRRGAVGKKDNLGCWL